MDSNHRPRAYQARALTTWAMSPWSYSVVFFHLPSHSDWWRWWDSNPWPPACRAGALPTELHPHGVSLLNSFRSRSPFGLLYRCRPWPIFPYRLQWSIVGTAELNFRVRNGYGWTLCVWKTNYWLLLFGFDPWKLNNKISPESVCHFFKSNTVKCRVTFTTFSIERRWSSRTFRYGYLVTT